MNKALKGVASEILHHYKIDFVLRIGSNTYFTTVECISKCPIFMSLFTLMSIYLNHFSVLKVKTYSWLYQIKCNTAILHSLNNAQQRKRPNNNLKSNTVFVLLPKVIITYLGGYHFALFKALIKMLIEHKKCNSVSYNGWNLDKANKLIMVHEIAITFHISWQRYHLEPCKWFLPLLR